MQRKSSMTTYTQYRRLILLLLIFPIYKLIDAVLHEDYVMTLIMIISIIIAVSAIIYLELQLKAAHLSLPGQQHGMD